MKAKRQEKQGGGHEAPAPFVSTVPPLPDNASLAERVADAIGRRIAENYLKHETERSAR